VSGQVPEKQFGPVDKWREMSGLYKLGFDPESFKGLMFPFLLMGGPIVLAILMWQFL
jgi:hypothetical protein